MDKTNGQTTEESVDASNTEESDEALESSCESSSSNADSDEEVYLKTLDELWSPDGSDEEWCPEVTPQRKKRKHQSSVSPSPAKSHRSASPGSAQSAKGKGKHKGRMRQHVSTSNSILESKWKSVDEPDIEPPQLLFKPKRTPGPQLISTASFSVLQYFELFFSQPVMQKIVDHSNIFGAMRHEARKRKWKDITVADLKSFIAMVIYMGIVKCFNLQDYWRMSDVYSLPYPAKIMSRTKFLTISWALHLSDPKVDAENDKKKGTPQYDPLCKIKPLYQDIRDACKASFHPHQNISIDERMVASKARHGLIQYISEPTKWGYKLFVLADSLCAYTWDFFIYAGKVKTEQRKGISYDSVMMLVDERVLGTGYKLFVDNFYTSPILFRDLLSKKIGACGTIRPNRINHTETEAPRGNIRWFREDGLLFVEWKDKRDVLMCSTFHKAYNGETVKRTVKGKGSVWGVKEFPVPGAVLDYNKYKGGEDVSNALIGYYTVFRQTKKWYRSFFYHFVDIAIVNAFILHQQMAKSKNQKAMTQKAFRETLITELTGIGSASTSTPKAPVPTTGLHLPRYISGDSTVGRRKCKLCQLKTPMICATCDVALCLVSNRNCYVKWHEQDSDSEEDDDDDD